METMTVVRQGWSDDRIDGLELKVDEGFRNVGERFERANERFRQIDKQFEQVDRRFEQVDQRFEQIDKRFEQVDERLYRIEVAIDGLRTQMATMQHSMVQASVAFATALAMLFAAQLGLILTQV